MAFKQETTVELELKHINRVRRLFNIKPVERKERKCLRCEKKFTSNDYGNRICRLCNEFNSRCRKFHV